MKTPLPIVITGVGVVSPYGTALAVFRAGLANSRSCIDDITAYDLSRCRARKGAYYNNFVPGEFDDSTAFGRVARGTQFSIIATEEALLDSNLNLEIKGNAKIGLIFSSSRVVLEKAELFYLNLLEKGPRLVNPLGFQESVNNAPASHICQRYGITGPSLTITSGGTSTIQAMAVAMAWLRIGRVDAVIVTSTESLSAISQVAHSYAHGHAPIKCAGVDECCPFDKRRNGYVFGEGSVAFIVETEAHAIARDAHIEANILGYGITHEANQFAQFNLEGFGIEIAMRSALKMANLNHSSMQWILAAARSSQGADLAEARAIKRLFGERKDGPPVSAIKSMIGETDAASGGFNILAAITGMEDGLLYPTINYQEPDRRCDLDHVVNVSRHEQVTLAMINATWNGGGCSSFLISRPLSIVANGAEGAIMKYKNLRTLCIE